MTEGTNLFDNTNSLLWSADDMGGIAFSRSSNLGLRGDDSAIIPLTEAEDSININIATRSLVVIDVRGSETFL